MTDLVPTLAHDPTIHALILDHLIETNRQSAFTVAHDTGLSDVSIYQILKGDRGATADEVVVLAGYFHVDPRVFG